MFDAKENGEEPQWLRWLRIGAFAIGLIAIAAGPAFHYFQPDPHVGWALMIAGLIFMVSSRFDDVVEIGFGSFRTKLERRVKKVEDTMEAVRHLAKASARSALNSVQYTGRMGGFTETEKIQFLGDTRRLLSDLDIKDDEIAETEHEWHKAVEFDYTHWATGHNQVTDRILESIRRAEYVIVDLTNSKSNVYYEAGYAQGQGKTPIYVARASTELEFDLKDYPIIFFKNMKELKVSLEKRIRGLSAGRRKT